MTKILFFVRQRGQLLGLVFGHQGVGEFGDVAVHDLVHFVQREVDAVVGNAALVKKIADKLANPDGSDNATSGSVRAALHGILACAGASAQGADCGSAALGASAGSVINSLMGGDPSKMTAQEKENRKNLVTSLIAGIATTAGAQASTATSAAQMETENNFLTVPELKKRNDSLTVLRDAQGLVGYLTGKGDRQKAAKDLLTTDAKDTRSDKLLNQYRSNPDSLTRQERDELAGYLNDYSKSYGEAATNNLLKNGPQPVMENGDINSLRGYAQGLTAGQEQAKWQADVGQPVLSVAALTSATAVTVSAGVDTVAVGTAALTTKAIGGAVALGTNVAVQSKTEPNEPIKKVDATIAAATGFLTTGASILPSIAINADGAFIGATIKGENPTAAVGGAILGTIVGYPVGSFNESVTSKVMKNSNPFTTYWTDTASGMARTSSPSNVPMAIGNGTSGFIQEGVSYYLNQMFQNGESKSE